VLNPTCTQLYYCKLISEKVRGIRTVVAFGREKFEGDAYGELADASARAEESVAKAEAVSLSCVVAVWEVHVIIIIIIIIIV
jgi:hypothetical protein